MSLVYITGVSGMGKSEVLKELKVRGFEAYGVDEDQLADWVNRSTGQAEELTEEFAKDIHAWFRDHAWVLSRKRIKELALKARTEHKTIFICGTADGFDACKDLFATIYALHMDDVDELSRRILKRTDVDFGKDPAELARILQWQQNSVNHFTSMGARLLDASKPVSTIVDDILTYSE